MVTYAVAFLVSLIVGALLTPLVRNQAIEFGWFDQAKSTERFTPDRFRASEGWRSSWRSSRH